MKKIIYLLLSLCIITGTFNFCNFDVYAEDNWPLEPAINAESAIIIEADSGAILYEKNSRDAHYPASITKIMTTLLALENCPLNDSVLFSKDAVYNVEGTQVGITPDEEVPLDECLYGIMLASGNEIAYAVAEHVGQTFENFVDMMNTKAGELGCVNTHFNNPHGLPDENHYTCAYDMALISRAAYSNETFRTIAGTKYHVIPPTNIYPEERAMANHHKMLTNTSYHYDYCTGGKTGYTNAARYNLVTFAEKDGLKLICVIMKDEEIGSQYTDTQTLFDYCFENFKKADITTTDLGINLNGSGLFPIEDNIFIEDSSTISIADDSYVVLPDSFNLENTTRKVNYDETTNNITSISYYYNEHLLGSIPITCNNDDSSKQTTFSDNATSKNKFLKINVRKIIYVVIGIILIICIIYGIKAFINNHHFVGNAVPRKRKRRSRKKKRSRRKKRTSNVKRRIN